MNPTKISTHAVGDSTWFWRYTDVLYAYTTDILGSFTCNGSSGWTLDYPL